MNSPIIRCIAEIEDYVKFCREWGIPVAFTEQDKADFMDIEYMAREWLKQYAASQPQPTIQIMEEDIPW